ncbi:MAG: hypothetical protein ACRC92_20425 [Peptostreptococcaceae bacterium]
MKENKKRLYVKVSNVEGLSKDRIYKTMETNIKSTIRIKKASGNVITITQNDRRMGKVLVKPFTLRSYKAQYPITRLTEECRSVFNYIFPIPNDIDIVYKVLETQKLEYTKELNSLKLEIEGLNTDIMVLNEAIKGITTVLNSNCAFIEDMKYKETRDEEERIERIKDERRWKERERRFNEKPSALFEYANYVLGRRS